MQSLGDGGLLKYDWKRAFKNWMNMFSIHVILLIAYQELP